MKRILIGSLVLVFGLGLLLIGCTTTTETTTTTAADTTSTSTSTSSVPSSTTLTTSTLGASTTTTTITTTTTSADTTTSTTTTTTTTITTTTTTTTTTSSTTTTIAVSNGLVAYYTFDESSGTTASDSSGNGHAGTVYGASWATGHIGNALSFDGTDDNVQIPASGEAAPTQINDLSVGSISLWFNFNGEPGEGGFMLPLLYLGASPEVVDSNEGVLIELGHKGIEELQSNNSELFYTVTLAGSSEPVFCYDSNFNLTAEAWHHFVVTVSSTENTGYINGEEISNRYYNFGDESDSYFLNAVTGNILSIGYGRFAFRVAGQFYYFDGLIDDIRIYDRPLTSAEVQELSQQ